MMPTVNHVATTAGQIPCAVNSLHAQIIIRGDIGFETIMIGPQAAPTHSLGGGLDLHYQKRIYGPAQLAMQ